MEKDAGTLRKMLQHAIAKTVSDSNAEATTLLDPLIHSRSVVISEEEFPHLGAREENGGLKTE